MSTQVVDLLRNAYDQGRKDAEDKHEGFLELLERVAPEVISAVVDMESQRMAEPRIGETVHFGDSEFIIQNIVHSSERGTVIELLDRSTYDRFHQW